MGVTRLDDAEYARRSRERNNRVNAAHRTRLLSAGKSQTNVWLSAELRERLDGLAVADGVNLSAVVERLLSAGLVAGDALIPDPEPESTGSSAVDSAGDRDALMALVSGLKAAGLSGAEIARRLNAEGRRSTRGAELNGGNILRDLRQWEAERAVLKPNSEQTG